MSRKKAHDIKRASVRTLLDMIRHHISAKRNRAYIPVLAARSTGNIARSIHAAMRTTSFRHLTRCSSKPPTQARNPISVFKVPLLPFLYPADQNAGKSRILWSATGFAYWIARHYNNMVTDIKHLVNRRSKQSQ